MESQPQNPEFRINPKLLRKPKRATIIPPATRRLNEVSLAGQ